mmetsp:Transcript_4128/g.9125  ORF Transcript_4128/g.9125 Transcript_4128/m.9125 type:complete len:206 (+) Transcript_4128:1321-1938(+)
MIRNAVSLCSFSYTLQIFQTSVRGGIFTSSGPTQFLQNSSHRGTSRSTKAYQCLKSEFGIFLLAGRIKRTSSGMWFWRCTSCVGKRSLQPRVCVTVPSSRWARITRAGPLSTTKGRTPTDFGRRRSQNLEGSILAAQAYLTIQEYSWRATSSGIVARLDSALYGWYHCRGAELADSWKFKEIPPFGGKRRVSIGVRGSGRISVID